MKDLELIMTIVKAMKPDVVAPVAPVAPVLPVHTNDDALMANNISYIQRDITEIKGTLKEITTTHVTVGDFNEHIKKNELTHGDHETRIRSIETSVTRMMTWGSVILIMSTLIQVGLKLAGK